MRNNRIFAVAWILYMASLVFSGCSYRPFTYAPLSDQNNPVLNTPSSGVGVVFVTSKDVDLPYTIAGLFTQHVPAGTFLKGTRVKQTSKTLEGDFLWKLCGKVVADGPQQELIIGDVSYQNGTIKGFYDELCPVPSVVPSFMSVTNGNVNLSAASQDDLVHATDDHDWIIRFYAYTELIRRKNATPQLRVILEKGGKDPVDIVNQTANSGFFDFYLSKDFPRPSEK